MMPTVDPDIQPQWLGSHFIVECSALDPFLSRWSKRLVTAPHGTVNTPSSEAPIALSI
jgi:hypothetical protein